jgi:hypothetical protein
MLYFELDSRGSLVKGSSPRFAPFPAGVTGPPIPVPQVNPALDLIPDNQTDPEFDWSSLEDLSSQLSSPFNDEFIRDIGSENDGFDMSIGVFP